ncbi:MAG: hypothetical protein RLZZ429_1624 [Bacteroidota bacterium]
MAGFLFHLFLHSQNEIQRCIFSSKEGDSVAQLVEQYTFNVWVLGSSPSGITQKEKVTNDRSLFCFYIDSRSIRLSTLISIGMNKGSFSNGKMRIYYEIEGFLLSCNLRRKSGQDHRRSRLCMYASLNALIFL